MRNGFIVQEITEQNIFLIEVNICSVLFSTFLSLEWLITIKLQVARKLCKHCYGKLMVSVIKGRLHSDDGGGIEDVSNSRIEQ